MGGEAGRAPSGGLRSCACSRTGWGRHHHHHHDCDNDFGVNAGGDNYLIINKLVMITLMIATNMKMVVAVVMTTVMMATMMRMTMM